MKKRIGEQKKDKNRRKIMIFCLISSILLLGIGLILYGIVTLQLWFAYGNFFKD